jgi:hypothetical protein
VYLPAYIIFTQDIPDPSATVTDYQAAASRLSMGGLMKTTKILDQHNLPAGRILNQGTSKYEA